MVDGAYDVVNEMLRPGIRERIVAANKFLYTHGSTTWKRSIDFGERCNPHPHNFTDRMIRPGDQAFFDILQSFMGYRTCYYRTFNVVRATPAQHDVYKKAREWLTTPSLASARRKHRTYLRGLSEGQRIRLSRRNGGVWLAGHGLGLNLHERSIISRVASMDLPTGSGRHGIRNRDLRPRH
jgi:Xaa-Pro dipeptidase